MPTATITRPTNASPRPPGVPPGPSNFFRPPKLAPVSVIPAVYGESDPDAELERPGVDEHGGELLPLRESVHGTQVTDREAEVTDARDVDLHAGVDAELPERRRNRAIELQPAHVTDAGETLCERNKAAQVRILPTQRHRLGRVVVAVREPRARLP